MAAFNKARLVPSLGAGETLLVVSYDDNLRALAAIVDDMPIERGSWRTGMALDYTFYDAMVVAAKDTMQSWNWD